MLLSGLASSSSVVRTPCTVNSDCGSYCFCDPRPYDQVAAVNGSKNATLEGECVCHSSTLLATDNRSANLATDNRSAHRSANRTAMKRNRTALYAQLPCITSSDCAEECFCANTAPPGGMPAAKLRSLRQTIPSREDPLSPDYSPDRSYYLPTNEEYRGGTCVCDGTTSWADEVPTAEPPLPTEDNSTFAQDIAVPSSTVSSDEPWYPQTNERGSTYSNFNVPGLSPSDTAATVAGEKATDATIKAGSTSTTTTTSTTKTLLAGSGVPSTAGVPEGAMMLARLRDALMARQGWPKWPGAKIWVPPHQKAKPKAQQAPAPSWGAAAAAAVAANRPPLPGAGRPMPQLGLLSWSGNGGGAAAAAAAQRRRRRARSA